MAVKIKPLKGITADPLTGKQVESDLGLDMVVVEEGGKSYEVGYAARMPNAAVSFIRPLSDSVRKEALKAVAARKCEDGGDTTEERTVTQVKPLKD